MARALCSAKCPNSYVMFGGFSAWKQAELPVAEIAVYDITPIDILSDKASDLIAPLEKPSTLVLVSLGALSTLWAVWNYHYILQLLGFLAPSIGITVSLLKKYDTVEEAIDDLEAFLARFVAKQEKESVQQLSPSETRPIEQEKADEMPIEQEKADEMPIEQEKADEMPIEQEKADEMPVRESNESVVAES